MDSEPSAQERLRPQDWAGAVFAGATLLALGAALRRRFGRALRWLVVAAGADAAARWLSRRNPGPFQARMKFLLIHPEWERRRLLESLDPLPGERILEIGPGAGHHAVDVARALAPDGRLDVLDIQQAMLDATLDRAEEHGITNLHPWVGDACARLPFDDDTFDGAYLSGVLGELPDQDGALAELRRVVKPGGRLVVAEFFLDPDFVPYGALSRRGRSAGFVPVDRHGPPIAYDAVLR